MKDLVIATTNPAKFERYYAYLSKYSGLNLLSLADFSVFKPINEPYNTAEENAKHKAKTYSKLLNQDVFAIDETFYFDFLPSNWQIGAHMRKFIGVDHEASDEEVEAFFKEKLSRVKGRASGTIKSAFCVFTRRGELFEAVNIENFVLLKKKKAPSIKGYPLSGYSFHEVSGKVYSEMTLEERISYFKDKENEIKNIIEKFLKV